MSSGFSPHWAELLAEAVSRPGTILEAYSRFHGYSLGNQLAAIFQCRMRSLSPGPIATLQRWNDLGRTVKTGEKALALCMPVTVRGRDDDGTAPAGGPGNPARVKTIFIWKPRWFVLEQTEGAPLFDKVEIPDWDADRALATLNVRRIPFALVNGNIQGYAEGRSVAVSPIADHPARTLFHELGHICLGHTDRRDSDGADLPRTLVEAEAEAVALLCVEALGLPGVESSRGYIQWWYGNRQPLPEQSAQRIFKAADTILRAGRGDAERPAVVRGAA